MMLYSLIFALAAAWVSHVCGPYTYSTSSHRVKLPPVPPPLKPGAKRAPPVAYTRRTPHDNW